MKIKASSWHYRLVQWANKNYNVSGSFFLRQDHIQLCPYVRRVVSILLEVVFKCTFTIFCGSCLIFVLLFPTLDHFGLVSLQGDATPLILISIALWMGLCAIAWCTLGKLDVKWNVILFDFKNLTSIHKEKEPNIFTLYIKAIHDKVCPTITVDHKD